MEVADRNAAPCGRRATRLLGPEVERVPAPARISDRAGSALASLSAILIISAAAHGGASAADWNVSGSLSTRVEADTNRNLDDDAEPVYGATARLGLEAAAVTDTSILAFRTGVSAGQFVGSGDTDGLNEINPDFRGVYEYDGKYIDAGADLAVQYEPVSFAQIDDTGITEGDATQFTVRLASRAAYSVDPRNRVTTGANLSLIRFTEGDTDLRPTTTIGGSLGWVHDIDPTTSWNLTFGARRFTADGTSSEERMTYDLGTGLDHQFNSRLSLQGGIGVSATERDGYDFGVTGNLAAGWQPTADTSLSFAFDHGIRPSSIGELRTSTSVGVGVAHSINSWTNLGMSLRWSRRAGGDSTTDDERNLLRFGSSIDFALAEAWQLGVGYALTMATDSGDDAVGNRVFMQLTRQFDIIP